jgi:hypothetical protein
VRYASLSCDDYRERLRRNGRSRAQAQDHGRSPYGHGVRPDNLNNLSWTASGDIHADALGNRKKARGASQESPFFCWTDIASLPAGNHREKESSQRLPSGSKTLME